MVIVSELKRDRRWCSPDDFAGYKLSLSDVPRERHEMDCGVHRATPNADQYVYKDVKLYSLHNHLSGESVCGVDCLYFVDGARRVRQVRVNGGIGDAVVVWTIPAPSSDRASGYNVTVELPMDELAIVGDGCGGLHIVQTGDRLDGSGWKGAHYEQFEFDFIIISSKFIEDQNRLRCLLHAIDSVSHSSVLYSVAFDKLDEAKWARVDLQKFSSKGELFWAGFEETGESFWAAADSTFLGSTKRSDYEFSQDQDCVVVKLRSVESDSVSVEVNDLGVSVLVEDVEVLGGRLCNPVKDNETTWGIQEGCLRIAFVKAESGLAWTQLFQDEEMLKKDDEVIPSDSSILDGGLIEECDFPPVSSSIERINREGVATHRINLSQQRILFPLKLTNHSSQSLAIQHNEDASIWSQQPDCSWEQVGALSAFAYVQASKQRRKFLGCAPDLDYAVICESNRHLFIYRQRRPVSGGELRNRTTGARVRHTAQQQIINLSQDEVVGMYCASNNVYILTEHDVYAFFLNVQTE